MELAVGQTIGAYRLIRKLGEGTTSQVFEVEHVRIRRRAAMKIAHTDAVLPGVSRRLFAEAEAVNLINHPNIVAITEIVEPTEEHPAFALVMELLDGRLLADVIADGALAPPRLLPILAQVCDGLAAVHAAGFVHRDLKPENICLVGCDQVKLLDFGLVKALRGDVASPTATCEGMFMGSPAYTSPEQAQGKAVDQRTDIYALGIMVHEVVTGRLPFEAEGIADLLMKQITAPPPRLSAELLATDVGRALDAIIQACLAKDPAERALTAAQLADMFRRLAAGERIPPARIRGAHGRGVASSRRRRGLALAVASGAAMVAAALLLGIEGGSRPGPAAPAPAVASEPAAPLLAPAPLAAAPAAPAAAVGATVADESASKSTRAPEARRLARSARGNVSSARTLDPYR